MSLPTIPDTRFEYTFRRALDKERAKVRAQNLVNQSQSQKASGQEEDVGLSAYVVCKVVVRDVLLMPFLQSVLWTGFLLGLKPWLRAVRGLGRSAGQYLNTMLYGGRLSRRELK
ncbi:hypothetical protein RNJ44_02908 [Nakaseomyces bracarensis]|uniref:Uncharacterized protein n=1 Tax=Nakaseomyces bracarensis TaxID=273131 RepID=A0ABR4P0K9_9SACH